ncbi:glutamine amidotransferase, partial [Escherichia coli]|uniref:glutamine amidotransferase n=1 Tax=Escherichia coli TaxID=562 RepID=UPI00224738DB
DEGRHARKCTYRLKVGAVTGKLALNLIYSTKPGFSEYPFFLGYNRAIAKENAEVVLTINNAPLLVFGNYHNGKIACFMSDCSPHWGTQQFMSWPFYTALWVNILTHIAR